MLIPHHPSSIENLHTVKHPFSDQEYGKILDHVVVGCVDVALVNRDEILLERRKNDPAKDNWWIFGGRILVDETLQDTAKRQVKRELDFEVEDSSRFQEIGIFNLRWPTRREPTVSNGVHHLLIAHMIEINDSERQSLAPKLLEATQPMRWLNIDKPGELLLSELQSILGRVQEHRAHRISPVVAIDGVI